MRRATTENGDLSGSCGVWGAALAKRRAVIGCRKKGDSVVSSRILADSLPITLASLYPIIRNLAITVGCYLPGLLPCAVLGSVSSDV